MAIRATFTAARFIHSHLIPILIILLLLGTTPLYGAVAQKNKKVGQKQIQECGEMVSRSLCSKNADCRWCQSDVLDDTFDNLLDESLENSTSRVMFEEESRIELEA
ncbi:hypothetical protein L1887_34421 [Cichorium endivia]|nr:hypothetical protein L1887_34421 [Cichorium endivia]